MVVSEVFVPLMIGVLGGLISAGVTYGFGRRTRRDSLLVDHLRETSAAMATHSRQLLHVMGAKPDDRAREDDRATAMESHAQIRINTDLLALVGNPSVQQAARLVRHHAYAAVATIQGREDPHPEYGVSVYTRLEWAIEMLLQATRKQIGLSGAVVRSFDAAELTRQSAAAHAASKHAASKLGAK